MYGAASKEAAPAFCQSAAEPCGTADSIIALTAVAAATTLVAAVLAASVVAAAMTVTMAGAATAAVAAAVVAGIVTAFLFYKHRYADVVRVPWVTAADTIACRKEIGKRLVGLGRLAGLGAGITTTHLKKPPSSSAEGGTLPPSYTTILCHGRTLGSCERKITRAG